jgi:hypothetical protein
MGRISNQTSFSGSIAAVRLIHRLTTSPRYPQMNEYGERREQGDYVATLRSRFLTFYNMEICSLRALKWTNTKTTIRNFSFGSLEFATCVYMA